MGLFEWGEKRFSRGIARAMIRSYQLLKADRPNLNERELIKAVLSTRNGVPAQEILNDIDDSDFWEGTVNKSFTEVIYILIRMEYIESIRGSLESENRETTAVFRAVLDEEIKNADL